MTNIQKSIVAASLINTMLCNYEAGELNSSGEELRKKVAKYMRKRSKSNHKEFVETITTTDIAWKATIFHFLKDKMKIESKATIAAVYNNFQDVCVKYIGIKEKRFEKFMIGSVSDAESEINSDKVIEFMLNELGFESKRSAFSGKRLTIMNNLILDGKSIDNKFLGVAQ